MINFDILHLFHDIFIKNSFYQYLVIQKASIKIFVEIYIYLNLYPEYERYDTIY